MTKLEEIQKYVKKGLTYQKIGEKFGLSRQRIHQIVKKGKPVKVKIGLYDKITQINQNRVQQNKLLDLKLPEYTIDDYLRQLPLPKSKKRMIMERDNFTCTYCGKGYPNVKLEVDHKIPLSRGGTHDYSNLTTACRQCNSTKSYKTEKEFINNEKIKLSNIFGW